MRIGIIAERRIKSQNPFERYQRDIIHSEKNPFELVIARIPYSVERLDRTSPKRLKRAVLKAEEILKISGADKIFFSALLKDFSVPSPDSRIQAFSAIIPNCIRNIAPKCGIHLPNCKICIKADKTDRITEYLAAELCYDAKKLILCVPDKDNAAGFRERFFHETGAFPEITDTTSADAEIFVDLSVPAVRIGRDIMIDGIELDLDLGGCDVDFLEIASYIGEVYTAKKISSYIMGKKKLTL